MEATIENGDIASSKPFACPMAMTLTLQMTLTP